MIAQIFFILFIPFVFWWFGKRVNWLKPIVIAYVLGVLTGNLFPGFLSPNLLEKFTGVSVLLAIPLLLFPTDVAKWIKQPKTVLLAFVLAVFSTIIAVLLIWFVFRNTVESPALSAGMLVGVYSGGTINLNAIALAFNDSSSHILLMNGYDMLISGVYLLFLLSVAPVLLSRFLKVPQKVTNDSFEREFTVFGQLDNSQKVKNAGSGFLASVLVVAISVGLSWLLFGSINEIVVIIGISLLGILASYYQPLRNLHGNTEMAEYFMLIFGFVIGAQAKVGDLLTADASLFYFMASAFVLMIVIHFILSRVFKVDRDAFIISSCAAIFGPPFIGPVADALDNRSLVAPGIVVAIIGNAVGTYLGLVVVYILT